VKNVILIDELIATKQRMIDALVMAGYTGREAQKLASLRITHVLDPQRRM
jgi:hypothetical protein